MLGQVGQRTWEEYQEDDDAMYSYCSGEVHSWTVQLQDRKSTVPAHCTRTSVSRKPEVLLWTAVAGVTVAAFVTGLRIAVKLQRFDHAESATPRVSRSSVTNDQMQDSLHVNGG
jgi:hypothetical protein